MPTNDDRSASDLYLEPIDSEDEDYESAPPEYQIATYPADYTLEGLYQKWQRNELIVPGFQRRFVWKQNQASRLIESFLVGLPVPAVFFYRERQSKKYMVIDGQQRLKSVFYYFGGYFGPGDNHSRRRFRLTGINKQSEFYNCAFDDLREEEQRELNDAVLRAFIVQQLNPEDDTSMYHIFERLNTGGTSLSNQEVRDCIYHGEITSFLDDINKLSNWRKILGKPKQDARKRDVELALRFLAMRDYTAYKNPMKDYLSKFMRKNRNATDDVFQGIRQIFEATCNAVISSLGEKPFHVRAGLNAAVFDSVMCAFSNHLDNIPNDVKGRYERLVRDDEFHKNTRSSTTNVDVVQGRFRQAASQLFDA